MGIKVVCKGEQGKEVTTGVDSREGSRDRRSGLPGPWGFRQSLGPFHKTSKLQGPDYPRHPQRVVRRDRVAQTPRSGTKLREPAGRSWLTPEQLSRSGPHPLSLSPVRQALL